MSYTEQQYLKNTRDSFRAGREVGADEERERLMSMLVTNKVLRIDALGSLVFVNCDTLEVQYLSDSLIQGVQE